MFEFEAICSGVIAAIAAFASSAAFAQTDDDGRAAMDPLSRSLLFPRRYEVADPEYARLRPDVVHFENAQGAVLRGLWFESGDSDRTVLVCMGNTGNATWMVPHAAILVDGGFDVLLFDYQGFGASEGVASLLSLPGDALAAWEFVTGEKGRAPAQVGVLGISLGTVLALQLAAEKQPAACAVEDVFFPDVQIEGQLGVETTPGMSALLAGLKALVLPRIDPRRNAKKYVGPLFLMHGDRDFLLTPMASIELAAMRPDDRRIWILAETGHSPDSLQIDEWEYRDQLAAFFRDAFAGPLSEPAATFVVESTQPARVRVAVTVPASERASESSNGAAAVPLQITLVGANAKGEPLFHHERRFAQPGTTSFECSPAFTPSHVVATAMVHARDRRDGTWERELSPLSQSLAELFDFVIAIRQIPADVAVRFESTDDSKKTIASGFRARSADQWPAIAKLLPDAESIHPRIRPRFAMELAWRVNEFDRLSLGRPAAHEAAIAAAEAMLPFLPPDPPNFVTLGNAYIEVGFKSPIVEQALVLLWHDRIAKGDVAGAAEVWRELVKHLPAARAAAEAQELK